eukprot:m.145036 g.145036  ORF g.145036 m.145036 type:complete len:61 (-) comp14136_c1_seq1:338-520(-)
MRFLNCTEGRKDPTRSILDVSVEEALRGAGFDQVNFKKRGGDFFQQPAAPACGSSELLDF